MKWLGRKSRPLCAATPPAFGELDSIGIANDPSALLAGLSWEQMVREHSGDDDTTLALVGALAALLPYSAMAPEWVMKIVGEALARAAGKEIG